MATNPINLPAAERSATTESPTRSTIVGLEVNGNIDRLRKDSTLKVEGPSISDIELTSDVIRQHQRNDAALQPIINAIECGSGKPTWTEIQSVSETTRVLWAQFESLKLLEGVLHREFYTGNGTVLRTHIVLPISLQQQFLKQIHEQNVTTAHLSRRKTSEHVQ
jgi:hypothetical protein